MDRVEKAQQLFRQGFSCAQSIAGAYAEELSMTEEQALRLSSSFGAGMGRMREVCGTFSGILMVAGVQFGYSEADDEAKKKQYILVQDLAAKFRAQNGSILCRELLASLKPDTSPVPSPRTETYYKVRPCIRFVKSAAEILEELLAQKPQK